MKRILILTVGGSDAPILNAIRQNQPDFVYFVCTTGGGPGASDRTLTEGVRQTRKSVCAHCKRAFETVDVAGPILAKASLAQDRFAVETVATPDDLDEIVAACERIDQDTERRFAGADLDVLANYTGGSKTMSLGLGLYAYLTEGRWQLQLNMAGRQDLVRVTMGDVATQQRAQQLRLRQAREAARRLAERFDWESGIVVLEGAIRSAGPAGAVELQALLLRLRALAAWDRFDYGQALAFCQEDAALRGEFEPRLKTLLRCRGLVQGDEQWHAKDVSGAVLVEDVVANARRCAARGRFDDALGRLYRATEMLAQVRLRRAYAIHTANAEAAIGRLGPAVDGFLAEQRDPESRGIELGLMSAAALLGRIGDPLGRRFAESQDRLKQWIGFRNQSLFAHGLEPVDEASWRAVGESWISWMEGALVDVAAPPAEP
jgi:CRISPR-associated protein (TIGR02710 family)